MVRCAGSGALVILLSAWGTVKFASGKKDIGNERSVKEDGNNLGIKTECQFLLFFIPVGTKRFLVYSLLGEVAKVVNDRGRGTLSIFDTPASVTKAAKHFVGLIKQSICLDDVAIDISPKAVGVVCSNRENVVVDILPAGVRKNILVQILRILRVESAECDHNRSNTKEVQEGNTWALGGRELLILGREIVEAVLEALVKATGFVAKFRHCEPVFAKHKVVGGLCSLVLPRGDFVGEVGRGSRDKNSFHCVNQY